MSPCPTTRRSDRQMNNAYHLFSDCVLGVFSNNLEDIIGAGTLNTQVTDGIETSIESFHICHP